MRGINERFIKDLTTGALAWFLEQVKTRNTLALEIRQGYINIYYRGGNALRIRQNKRGYRFEFDEKYCLGDEEKRAQFKALRSAEDYREHFDRLLSEMDNWLCKHPKPEREIQHRLIRLNTADFCILDIEYAGHYMLQGKRKGFRLDMIAVHDGKLIVIENKNGTSAMAGPSGIAKHYHDICAIIDDDEAKSKLIDSMRNISGNKKALGLPSAGITRKEIELLFIVFNPNQKSKLLGNQLAEIPKKHPAKIIYMDTASEIQYEKASVLI